jgi:hypothetical protein
MIKKHTGAKKLVTEITGGDPAPTWENKLKNQMGYAHMSNIAHGITGKGKSNYEDQAQLLSDLGVKTTTENTGPEMAEDAMVRRGKKIV